MPVAANWDPYTTLSQNFFFSKKMIISLLFNWKTFLKAKKNPFLMSSFFPVRNELISDYGVGLFEALSNHFSLHISLYMKRT